MSLEQETVRVFGIVPVLDCSILCQGWENSIAQCTFMDICRDDICNHSKDLFIFCARKESCIICVNCLLAVL